MPCSKTTTKTKEAVEAMVVDPCADECIPQLDQVQMGEIYDMFNVRVRADLQDDFDCKKINGATYADTWARIMGPTINGTMQAMVSLATKETAKDRCVKEAQCTKLAAETLLVTQQEALALAQTTEVPVKSLREDGLATATNALKGEQGLLYARQAKGFDDNAFQKLFDSQLNSWSMVFADTDLSAVTPPLQDENICNSFDRIKVGFGETPGECDTLALAAATTTNDEPSDVENMNTDNPEPPIE